MSNEKCLFKLGVDHGFQAGATGLYYKQWQKLTSDRFILQAVTGVCLDFDNLPSQICRPSPLKFLESEFAIIDTQIKEFLQLGII